MPNFVVENNSGFRLVALLLRAGHVGLVLKNGSQPSNDQLECFFPVTLSLEHAVLQALCAAAPGVINRPVRPIEVYSEAQYLLSSMKELVDLNSCLLYRSDLLAANQVLDCQSWLLEGGEVVPTPLRTGALESTKTLVQSSQQFNFVFPSPSLFLSVKEVVSPQQQQLLQQQSCGVCRQPFSDSCFVVSVHHHPSDRCFVHLVCCRSESSCPLHPNSSVSHVIAKVAHDRWVQLPKEALAPPVVTQLLFPWLTDNAWNLRTWDLLNGLCDGVETPISHDPLNQEQSIVSLVRSEIEKALESHHGHGLPTFVGQGPEDLELQFVRACLFLTTVSSGHGVARWRAVAGFLLAQVCVRGQLVRQDVRQLIGAAQRITDDLYHKIFRVGLALQEWPLLVRALISNRVHVSWNLARLSMTAHNVRKVQRKALQFWQLQGLVRVVPEHSSNRVCERCQVSFGPTETSSLPLVGGNHWWCRTCRRIGHELLPEPSDVSHRGIPSIGLTCYISCLLQLIAGSQLLMNLFNDHYYDEGWSFELPRTQQGANHSLLCAIASALRQLSSGKVRSAHVAAVQSAMANTIKLDYYEREEQPLNEVVLGLFARINGSMWCSLGVWADGSKPRDFSTELRHSWSEAGIQGSDQLQILVVERHNQSTEQRPWDVVPSIVSVGQLTFQLVAFTVRLGTTVPAHFVAYRKSENSCLFCDNHTIREVEAQEARQATKKSDLFLYERRSVRFAEREDGNEHPSRVPVYTRSGRHSKRPRKK